MLSGISILCFAASYIAALALEISRLFFRSGVRGAILLAFAGAGLLAQTLFLAYRARTTSAAPLSSEFDWYLVAAWVLAAMYVYWTFSHPRTAVGLFALPLVLGLIAAAEFFAKREPFPTSQASQVWAAVHGIFLLLGVITVLVGFVAGLMHLVHSYQLKHKLRPMQGLQLPALEWLERVNTRAVFVAAVMLAVGFLSGMALNLVNRRHDLPDSVQWNDPVVWSSGVLLGWQLAAAAFSVLYRPARQGRKVAYLTVASFVCLAIAMGVWLMSPSSHAPVRQTRAKRRANSELGMRIAELGAESSPALAAAVFHSSSFIQHPLKLP
ncbi:MAG TPA: hypothetical protein VMV10_09790 [Pirellulales bacterium]|nr:hypothetical protein [Pirellulales bacterium]